MAKLLRHFGLGGKKAPPSQTSQGRQQDFFSPGFQPKAQGTDRISGILGEAGPREDIARRADPDATRSLPLSFEPRETHVPAGQRCPPPPPASGSPGRSSPLDGPSSSGTGLSPAGPRSLLKESAPSGPVDEKEPVTASSSGIQDTLSGDFAGPCGSKEELEGRNLEKTEDCGVGYRFEEDCTVPYQLKDLVVTEAVTKPKYYDPYASTATMTSASAQSTMDAGDFSHYRNLPVITAMMQNNQPSCSGAPSHLDAGVRSDETRVPDENLAGEPSADAVDKDDDDDDDDVENYMDLQEEEIVIPRTAETETWRTASPSLRAACIDAAIYNYDEPWDLANTQRGLEDRIRAAQKVEASGQKVPERQSQLFEGPDARPPEGYDKPWDLQPHMKDDRGQEGYDKPWDLRPHQKDLRPSLEYDVPWDKKVKNIERDLIAAKRAKDSTKGDGVSTASGVSATALPGPGLQSRVDGSKVADTRPGCDYDEPWDQKKKQLVSKVGDQGAKGPHSPSPGSQFQQLPSRSSGVWAKTIGERIDPKLPLEMQTWYHGPISRVDAENLLRVHREGSYLVRKSESNQDDYSLSVKSVRGFMHMKIIKNADGRYILGQFSQPFLSIPQMIYHYTVNKLPIKGADHMSLMYPICNELL